MPSSMPILREETIGYINSLPVDLKIIDVGAGCGTYADALPDRIMDAVEIYEPYITKFKLLSKYNEVFNVNIRDFDCKGYDLMIMGDVLEHLSVFDAQTYLDYAYNVVDYIVIVVPYQMKQGVYRGNGFERHLQDDLTEEVFLERYPQFKLLAGTDKFGLFIK